MIFEDFIKRNSELYPTKPAVICGDNTLTYSELWQKILDKTASLPKNEVVVFRVSQDIDFLLTYFGLHVNRSVAVPLEKDVLRGIQGGCRIG